jgi:hypothetical protein
MHLSDSKISIFQWQAALALIVIYQSRCPFAMCFICKEPRKCFMASDSIAPSLIGWHFSPKVKTNNLEDGLM